MLAAKASQSARCVRQQGCLHHAEFPEEKRTDRHWTWSQDHKHTSSSRAKLKTQQGESEALARIELKMAGISSIWCPQNLGTKRPCRLRGRASSAHAALGLMGSSTGKTWTVHFKNGYFYAMWILSPTKQSRAVRSLWAEQSADQSTWDSAPRNYKRVWETCPLR